MTRIEIQGLGLVGPFGNGVDAFAAALAGAESPLGQFPVPTPEGPVALPALRSATRELETFAPPRTLRRMDHFSRLGLLGAHLALADGNRPDLDPARLGLVIASGHGATGTTFSLLDSMIQDGDPFTSPIHFANSLHNASAANISLLLGVTGPCLTVSQFQLSVGSALLAAQLWLEEGRVDQVLFGAVDELSELIAYAWHRRRGSFPGPMRPLLTAAETALPGEGAAFLLLGREDGRSAYCTLEATATGGRLAEGLRPPPGDHLVLAADGRRALGAAYATAAAGATVSCFTPLYGSSPASPGFDLAAAALMLKAGRSFGSPGGECDFPAQVAQPGDPLKSNQITCLCLAGTEGFASTTLAR